MTKNLYKKEIQKEVNILYELGVPKEDIDFIKFVREKEEISKRWD